LENQKASAAAEAFFLFTDIRVHLVPFPCLELSFQTKTIGTRIWRHNAVGIFILQFGRPGCGSVDSFLQGVSVEAKQRNQRFIQQGCRNIAHIVDFDDRYQGYCEALIQNGLPVDKALVYQEGGAVFSYNRGCRAAGFLLDSKANFDGIVTQSDEEAMGVMNVLMKRGVQVPGDVRIIGMDNAPYCNFAQVSMS